MTATTERRPTLPMIQCQPWCIEQDGHPECRFAEDQYCIGDEHKIDLTLYPALAADDSPTGVAGPDALTAYVSQRDGEATPHVSIVHDSSDDLPFFEIKLTAGDARQLAANLLLALDEVEGTS